MRRYSCCGTMTVKRGEMSFKRYGWPSVVRLGTSKVSVIGW